VFVCTMNWASFVPGMDKCVCVCHMNCSSIAICNTDGRVNLNV